MKKSEAGKARMVARMLVVVMLFTLALSAPLVGAQGQEQVVTEAIETDNLLDFFKSTAEDFSNPMYWKVYEYEYVNESGETRYYLSYLKEIDGFKRTQNSREIQGALWSTEEDQYPFEGDYVHLYYNIDDNFVRPIYSDELTLYIDGHEWRRTILITSIGKEVLAVLEEINAYRVTDNIIILGNTVDSMKSEGGIGIGVLLPKELTADSLVAEYFAITDDEDPYNDELNGYLIHNDHLLAGYAYLNATEEEKIFTFERKK